jgi:hypothetical protein
MAGIVFLHNSQELCCTKITQFTDEKPEIEKALIFSFVVAYAYNSSYLGDRDRRILV